MTDAPQPATLTVRKARMDDVEAIHGLVMAYSREQVMLARSKAALYESLRDFEVAEVEGRVVGCAALTIVWGGLAEVRSLAIASDQKGRGLGRRLVEGMLAEARRLGIGKVFALTTTPEFFERLGFRRIPKETLPHKIWADCIHCPKFPDYCDEEAVVFILDSADEASADGAAPAAES